MSDEIKPPRRRIGGSGARMRDVAERAGVSPMTVSRALSTPDRVSAEMRERVVQAVKEIGYLPNHLASSLSSNRSTTIGLIVPILCWFHPAFVRTRLAKLLIVALALLRIADAQLTQGGLCVRFDPQRTIVKDETGRPHSWDVRADWRSPDPACSAVLTTGWKEYKRFPAWFFNLPPAVENKLPGPDDRPPYTTLKMTVVGYLDVETQGSLDLQVGKYTPTTMMVDGAPAEQTGEVTYRIDVRPGLHLVQIVSLLHSNQWHFNASFNQHEIGTAGFPLATIERPAARDRGLLRPIVGWLTTILTAVFILGWIAAALHGWGDVTTLAWAAAE